ncbi:hypothetical protein [Dyella japonica]|uniref:DUF1579 domain-containing protein n=1 Tax=Dyella japonica A8 TaxID=1217721 RepID=A0A075K573_9GAMM|nr:hypothetical protein [Dyella japonica]AIF48832.1 hypothetical protein HY57_17080 [Dyella japonica A8]
MTPFVRHAFVAAVSLGFTAIAAQAVAADVSVPAARATESHQFDFLLGQWQVKGEVKATGLFALIHGAPKLSGHWKAWHAVDGQGIEDELRLTDASGNPLPPVQFTRIFSREENCWKITVLDAAEGHAQPSTGHWQDGDMVVTGNAADHEGKHYQSRTHFTAITSTGFRMVQDRSYDEGKTWETAYVTLNASRTGS